MNKKEFLIGLIVLIMGFVAYRFGVAINIAKNTIVAEFVLNYTPNGISPELLGILLEFGGGIILLLGIIVSVTALTKAERVHYMPMEEVQEKTEAKVSRCKFCSAELGDNIFCSECGRSQE